MDKNVFMILEGEFPPDLRVMNEAESLQRGGFNVYVFSLDFSKRKPVEVLDNGVTVVRKSASKSLYNKFRISVRWLPFVNRFWIRFVGTHELTPAYIHVHDLPLAKDGWTLAKKYRAKFILDLHENYPAALDVWSYSSRGLGRLLMPRWQWRRFEKKAVQKADHVIVVIKEALASFQKGENGVEKFKLVSKTINLDELGRLSFSKIKDKRFAVYFNVVYTGGFGPHRGIDVLLESVPLIREQIPHIRVWIVGEGSDRPAMEKLAEDLGISDSVVFTGFKPMSEMSEIIYHCDAAIVPHIMSEHTETTIPHKIFHYMFWKKPIIASDCSPIKRIIEETNSGVVYRSTDEKDLAEKVIGLYSDKTPYGENGVLAVREKYNWKVESKKILRIYNELYD